MDPTTFQETQEESSATPVLQLVGEGNSTETDFIVRAANQETTDPMETRFLLADNLYCKALVPPTDKVCLWLGANVMLEYDIDEAQALLEKNLATATRNLDSLEEDLDFLRDQKGK
ncbi:UNVERIFIED_CONTAM: hypothetical protein FKN15_014127 [Acipenser sinensis]